MSDNMINEIEEKDATELAKNNYTEFAMYVNNTRALASLYDGLKLVQRRIIYRLNQLPVGKIYKSPELDGLVMAYHPHGGTYGPMANMANQSNNLPMFGVQGNFGGPNTGASSSRYTGAYLNEVARFIYCQFVDYTEYIDGELKREPKYLPCLIPYSFIENSSGIGVGLTSDTLAFDLMDLVDYYINYIQNDYNFDKNIPMFELGSAIINCDRDGYNELASHYKNSVEVKPVIKQESDSVFVLESLNGLSIDKLCQKLSKYIDSEQVDFRDETKQFERYVFEINDMSISESFINDLNKFSKKRISYRFSYDKDGVSIFCNINYVIKHQMKMLNLAIDKKLENEKNKLIDSLLFHRAFKQLKENKYFDNMSSRTIDEQISLMVKSNEQGITITEELAKDILKSRSIKFILKSSGNDEDLNKEEKEIEDLLNKLDEINNHDRKKYLIDMYEKLREMIKPFYSKKHHTILSSEVIDRPRARLGGPISPNQVEITGKGRGVRFSKYLILIGENGGLYKRNISVSKPTIVDPGIEERVVKLCSDEFRFIEIIANDGTGICFDMDNYKYDKKVVNLWGDQKIVDAIGYTEKNVPQSVRDLVRKRVSKTMKYKK